MDALLERTDTVERSPTTESPRRPRIVVIAYDQLIVATGARETYFGHDEWAAVTLGLKRIEDATTMRRRILAAFEHAEDAADEPERRLAGKPAPPPFRYHDRGKLATIGRREAVVDFGWLNLTGRIAWLVWGVAHIYFLTGSRNRARLITGDDM